MRVFSVAGFTTIELDAMCDQLEGALDDVISTSGKWRDVPNHFTCEELFSDDLPDNEMPERLEMQCAYCASRFWAITWNVEDAWECFYRQAGMWFGTPGRHLWFPVCSDGCHDALERQLEKRRIHTADQMRQIGKARRLIAECKSTVRRVKREQHATECSLVHTGRS